MSFISLFFFSIKKLTWLQIYFVLGWVECFYFTAFSDKNANSLKVCSNPANLGSLGKTFNKPRSSNAFICQLCRNFPHLLNHGDWTGFHFAIFHWPSFSLAWPSPNIATMVSCSNSNDLSL